ncbi:AfsR/SARP family transcriptional regulator [Amycolatopsis sp. OK19-0408]|uniref:AfsR/SARP family transcriptional regulator n=1 Tax=Amycolatopsis iheyensis TaxID=2945988 RepID=A0A9X2SKG8_9PSEU|nr:AfsR/SARP family transcriptional regulator [Amycolatopsis iheyensis]MCR6485767.1 AfsR/SARP family transcriptional regulator [Amycolatopsis iheyensis]
MLSFKILGPVTAETGGGEFSVGGPRERKALGVLLLDASRPTPVSRLADVLWEGRPPRSAGAQIRNVVAILRRSIAEATGEAAPIRRSGQDVTISVAAGQLDLAVFRERTRVATGLAASGDRHGAAEELRRGLALWRGPLFGDAGSSALDIDVYQLEEERLAALEHLLELEVAVGRSRVVVGELAALTARYPLRERLIELYMLALHRSGRRTAALEVFGQARARLRDEAGLDPRRELVALHAAVLRDEAGSGVLARP